MHARVLVASAIAATVGLSACGSDSTELASPPPEPGQVTVAPTTTDEGPTAHPRVTAPVTSSLAATARPTRSAATTAGASSAASSSTAADAAGDTRAGAVAPGSDGTGRALAPSAVPTALATSISIANPGAPAFLRTHINPYYGSAAVFNPDQGEVAWWNRQGFGAPGRSTTSVLAGHVTFDGVPDVFWSLPRTRPGAVVTVTYADGTTTRWQVTDVLSAPKESVASMQSPVGSRVWGQPGLRLITCDTSSGRRADGHTVSNTVVLANRIA